MTPKELLDNIVSIVDTTDNTYTEERACSSDDIRILINEYLQSKKDSPYIEEVVTIKRYNPNFGDNRKCKCGHSYIRHFDLYDCDDEFIGCKYCGCEDFVLDE